MSGGSYFYDGNGKRVRKTIPLGGGAQQETIFVYDAFGKLAAEYENVAPVSRGQATTKYLTTDHLGSPRVVTNSTGAIVSRHDYQAYGEEVAAGVSNRTTAHKYATADQIRQQFTGYERDTESGLDYAQARYYNSRHGRFTSVDPLTASASIRNPQTFNRYAYALNSPYKFTDPLGLAARQPFIADNRDGTMGGCDNDRNCTEVPVRDDGEGEDLPGGVVEGGQVGTVTVTASNDPEPVQSNPDFGRIVPGTFQRNLQLDFETVIDLVNGRPVRETPVGPKGVSSDVTTATLEYSDVNAGPNLGRDTRPILDAPLDGDDRGHIISAALGGPAIPENLFNQNLGVNRGVFERFERGIRQTLTNNRGWRAEITVTLNYNSPAQTAAAAAAEPARYFRPTSASYKVRFTNGNQYVSEITRTFSNNPRRRR